MLALALAQPASAMIFASTMIPMPTAGLFTSVQEFGSSSIPAQRNPPSVSNSAGVTLPISGDAVGAGVLFERFQIFSGGTAFTIVTPAGAIEMRMMAQTLLLIHLGVGLGYDNTGHLTGSAVTGDILGATGVPGAPGVQVMTGMRLVSGRVYGGAPIVIPIFGVRVFGFGKPGGATQPSQPSPAAGH